MTDDRAAGSPRKRRGPWIWVLAFLVASVAGFAILVGVGCAIGANTCPFGEKRVETSTDGATIFARNCALCHGVDAAGTQNAPSLIAGSAATLSLDDLEYKIGRGRPFAGMPAFKRDFSDEQIAAVAGYLVELRGQGSAAPEQEVSP